MAHPIDRCLRKVPPVFLVGAAFCLPLAAYSAEPAAVVGGVCELVQHPQLFNGKTVRLHAEFMSDGTDRTGLIDRRCSKGWIVVLVSDEGLKRRNDYWLRGIPGKDKDARPPLAQVIQWGLPLSTSGAKITGTFTGKFVWRDEDGPRGALIVDEVSDATER